MRFFSYYFKLSILSRSTGKQCDHRNYIFVIQRDQFFSCNFVLEKQFFIFRFAIHIAIQNKSIYTNEKCCCFFINSGCWKICVSTGYNRIMSLDIHVIELQQHDISLFKSRFVNVRNLRRKLNSRTKWEKEGKSVNVILRAVPVWRLTGRSRIYDSIEWHCLNFEQKLRKCKPSYDRFEPATQNSCHKSNHAI